MNPAHRLLLIAIPLAAAGLSYALHDAEAAPLPALAAEPTGSGRTADPAVTDATARGRRDAQARIGTFWAPAGSRFGFELKSNIAMAVTTHEGGREQRNGGQDLRHAGTLSLTVVARHGRELVVAVSCPDLAIEGVAPSDGNPELMANLASARDVTRIKMDADGRILGYHFPTTAQMTQRNWLRGLYGGFAFVVPSTHGEQWSANGFDSTGEFDAEYRLVGDADGTLSIERSKQRYAQHGAAEAMQMELAGKANAGIDVAELGWLRACRIDESTHIKSTEMPVEFDVEQHASLELKSQSFDPAAIDADAVDLDWAPAGGQLEDGNQAIAERELQERRAAVEGMTVSSLNAELVALLAQSDSSRELYEAWRKACTMLAMDKDAIADVSRLLLDPNIDPKLASLWLSALADAGTPDAQDAVLTAFADQRLDAQIRGAAASSMFDVRKPTDALVSGLSAHIGALNSIDAVDATSVLALGALAQRDPIARAGDVTAREAVESWQGRARTLGAEDLWLDAMANAKSPKLADAAAAALGDERLHVRSAAVRALGGIAGEDALNALVRTAHGDPAPEVRSTALTQLATRSEPAAHEAILAAAETDTDTRVRDAALTALARSGITTADRTRLEAIARNDSESGLREFAARLLRGD